MIVKRFSVGKVVLFVVDRLFSPILDCFDFFTLPWFWNLINAEHSNILP